jgi:hypothetical protein
MLTFGSLGKFISSKRSRGLVSGVNVVKSLTSLTAGIRGGADLDVTAPRRRPLQRWRRRRLGGPPRRRGASPQHRPRRRRVAAAAGSVSSALDVSASAPQQDWERTADCYSPAAGEDPHSISPSSGPGNNDISRVTGVLRFCMLSLIAGDILSSLIRDRSPECAHREKNSQTKCHAGPTIYDLSDCFNFEFLLCGIYLIFLLKIIAKHSLIHVIHKNSKINVFNA